MEKTGRTGSRRSARVEIGKRPGSSVWFDAYGFQISWRRCRWKRWMYIHVEPHTRSQQKLRDKVKELLNRNTLNRPEEEVVRELNQLLTGWRGYFHFGNPSRVFGKVNFYVAAKLCRWLWKRHGKARPKSHFFATELYDKWGLVRLG